MDGAASGRCRTCAGSGLTGMPFNSWVRDTFTDWDKITLGDIVCHACQFGFTDRSDPLRQLTGKDSPQKMRNYSHFIYRGDWIPLSKGSKREMRRILLDGPEIAIVALSGQKHLIFRAQPDWWQIEDARFRPFPEELTRALALLDQLLAMGFSKSEIGSGRYLQHRILTCGLSAWDPLERGIRALRGGHVLDLALFLAQKEEEED